MSDAEDDGLGATQPKTLTFADEPISNGDDDDGGGGGGGGDGGGGGGGEQTTEERAVPNGGTEHSFSAEATPEPVPEPSHGSPAQNEYYYDNDDYVEVILTDSIPLGGGGTDNSSFVERNSFSVASASTPKTKRHNNTFFKPDDVPLGNGDTDISARERTKAAVYSPEKGEKPATRHANTPYSDVIPMGGGKIDDSATKERASNFSPAQPGDGATRYSAGNPDLVICRSHKDDLVNGLMLPIYTLQEPVPQDVGFSLPTYEVPPKPVSPELVKGDPLNTKRREIGTGDYVWNKALNLWHQPGLNVLRTPSEAPMTPETAARAESKPVEAKPASQVSQVPLAPKTQVNVITCKVEDKVDTSDVKWDKSKGGRWVSKSQQQQKRVQRAEADRTRLVWDKYTQSWVNRGDLLSRRTAHPVYDSKLKPADQEVAAGYSSQIVDELKHKEANPKVWNTKQQDWVDPNAVPEMEERAAPRRVGGNVSRNPHHSKGYYIHDDGKRVNDCMPLGGALDTSGSIPKKQDTFQRGEVVNQRHTAYSKNREDRVPMGGGRTDTTARQDKSFARVTPDNRMKLQAARFHRRRHSREGPDARNLFVANDERGTTDCLPLSSSKMPRAAIRRRSTLQGSRDGCMVTSAKAASVAEAMPPRSKLDDTGILAKRQAVMDQSTPRAPRFEAHSVGGTGGRSDLRLGTGPSLAQARIEYAAIKPKVIDNSPSRKPRFVAGGSSGGPTTVVLGSMTPQLQKQTYSRQMGSAGGTRPVSRFVEGGASGGKSSIVFG